MREKGLAQRAPPTRERFHHSADFQVLGSSRFPPLFFLSLAPFSLLCIPLTLLHAMCLIRVVNDAHSPATKKNKEWQEKLPVVVLKAEEIMYSKANSEVFLSFPQILTECGGGFLDLSLCWVKPLLLNFFVIWLLRQST